MANDKKFVRPMLPGERQGQAVRKADKATAANAVLGGASNLPLNAVITFPFDEAEIYEQDRQNSDQKNYYIGAKVNDRDRCILVGTFMRTDFNGDGSEISPEVTTWARQFGTVQELADALLGKTLKVTGMKKCQTSVWKDGVATEAMRPINYPILEFVEA